MLKALLVGLLLGLPFSAWAGSIRLLPEAQLGFTNGVSAALVQITNLGDDSIQLTSIQAESQSHKFPTHVDQFLLPGDVFKSAVILTNQVNLADSAPVVIRIKYAHANGLSYSSLVLAALPMNSADEDAWISLSIAPVSVGRDGSLSVQLVLLEDEPAEVTLRLILPDEFSVQTEAWHVVLEPDIPRVETFELSNRAAVPGSSYQVFAMVEPARGAADRGGKTIGKRYATVEGAIRVVEAKWIGQSHLFWGGLSLVLMLALLVARRIQHKGGDHLVAWDHDRGSSFFDAVLLAVVSGFMVWHLSPLDLLRNTTPVGGDTPAHLYLVSHLRDQLFGQGRIISWAEGWWCGFPMFQYYFVLPYLVAALLSYLIPLNIAFKCVSVAGLMFTPCCAYYAARVWRVPAPGPALMALAMVPFLFVQSHTMWGVNTASTLAGMIANSWSFALLLPALALGTRDITEGVIRGRTVALFVLVLASHFFTSVVMFMSLAIVPFLPGSLPGRSKEWVASLRRGVLVLGIEASLALLLMGWWLVPLVAKSGSCMDFGENWVVSLFRSFPVYIGGGLLFGVVAVMAGVKRSLPVVWLLVWMGCGSVVLFKVGYSISPVFINVRLWPFIFFAVMALGAVGLGVLLERVRGGRLAVGILVPVVLGAVMMSDSLSGGFGPGLTRSWATWNFSGLETKPSASVFAKMMPLLQGSPGRLANDLCEENNQLGSSRVFELVPYLTKKPILEGGLVNSALGSMYSYYIQSETSPSCAGFPPIVKPSSFDFVRATRHLELFNVKHFVARSALTRQALADMKEWRFVAREQEWVLYELMTHDGRYVFIPPRMPYVIETTRWKECSLEWLYTPQALDQFMLWKMPGMKPVDAGLERLSESQFHGALRDMRNTNSLTKFSGGAPLLLAGTKSIQSESVTDGRIRFRTSALGLPHIIKMTWFPNWKVRGASQVYCISPGFMCVFPQQADVELYYGTTGSDVVGYLFTSIGVCLALVWAVVTVRKDRKD